jgi:calcineurin-like phosphoesterase family protein
MKKVWFTADTHFGHKRIPFYTKRRFCLSPQENETMEAIYQNKNFSSTWSPSWESISRMDEYLFDKINSFVGRDDILWHLGDFCFGRREEREKVARQYRSRIECRNVFLIMGNHDSPEIKTVFDGCHDSYEVKVNSKSIVLSHYAHAFWNKSHNKSWMLYGHAHGTAEDWLDAHMPGRLSMDVGVDNVFKILGEYRPISFEEINDIFSQRNGHIVDQSRPVVTKALYSKKN